MNSQLTLDLRTIMVNQRFVKFSWYFPMFVWTLRPFICKFRLNLQHVYNDFLPLTELLDLNLVPSTMAYAATER